MHADWYRSATFRLVLRAVPFYLAAGWIMLLFVFLNTRNIMENRVNLGLSAERERIVAGLADRDSAAVEVAILFRIQTEAGSSRLYRLDDGTGHATVGNFRVSHGLLPEPGQISDVLMHRSDDRDTERAARLLGIKLATGQMLVLGRDLTEEDEFRRVIEETLLIGAVLMGLLALVAGSLSARGVIGRLAGFNAVAHRILHGHLHERMPLSGTNDEFDQLAENLNTAIERIEELMEATRNITNDIAHDLRSPLSRIRNSLENLQITNATKRQRENALARCVEDLDDVLETFESLLSIARLEHGAPPAFEPTDLRALLVDVYDYFLPLAEERGQLLRLDADEGAIVSGDRNLLFQALSNLVDNAIRYTPNGGAVTIRCKPEAESVVVSVADNGVGIPTDDRERVLRRFVRLDPSRSLPGSGLGLALVNAVARLHQTTIGFSDNNPGTVATLTFPYAGGFEFRHT